MHGIQTLCLKLWDVFNFHDVFAICVCVTLRYLMLFNVILFSLLLLLCNPQCKLLSFLFGKFFSYAPHRPYRRDVLKLELVRHVFVHGFIPVARRDERKRLVSGAEENI